MPTGHQTGPSAAQSSVSRRNSNFCQWHVKFNVPEPCRNRQLSSQSFRPSTSQENKKGNQDLFYFGKTLISNAEISLRLNKWVQGEPGIWCEKFWVLSEHIWALVHHMEKSPLTHTTNGLNPCRWDVITAVVSEQSWWSGCAAGNAGKPVRAMRDRSISWATRTSPTQSQIKAGEKKISIY